MGMIVEGPLVIDASVAVKLVLPEEGSEAARSLVGALLASDRSGAIVPDLFFPECAHALRKGILEHGLPPDLVARGLDDLCALGWESVPTRTLVTSALAIAREEGPAPYDAVYVALSDRTGAPLVTADRKLIERLAGTRHRVRWLGDFAPAVTPRRGSPPARGSRRP